MFNYGVMMILAKGGDFTCRIRIKTELDTIEANLKPFVRYDLDCPAINHAAWRKEIEESVKVEVYNYTQTIIDPTFRTLRDRRPLRLVSAKYAPRLKQNKIKPVDFAKPAAAPIPFAGKQRRNNVPIDIPDTVKHDLTVKNMVDIEFIEASAGLTLAGFNSLGKPLFNIVENGVESFITADEAYGLMGVSDVQLPSDDFAPIPFDEVETQRLEDEVDQFCAELYTVAAGRVQGQKVETDDKEFIADKAINGDGGTLWLIAPEYKLYMEVCSGKISSEVAWQQLPIYMNVGTTIEGVQQ
jgi:hypothetical protein